MMNSPIAEQATGLIKVREPLVHERHSVSNTNPSDIRPSTSQLPIWIRKTTLMSFLLLFLACAASLIALDRNVSSRNGLALTFTDNHYYWTYGPTAILVVILSLWRLVDYYLKVLQPWWEMARGPSPAAKSVLLDYISPFQVLTCVQAVRHGHYAVAISTIGFFLIKTIIFVSTTLFVIGPSVHLEAIPIKYQNSFQAPDMSNYEENYMGVESNSFYSLGKISASIFQGLSWSWSYLSVLNNATSGDPVYQSFALSSDSSRTSDFISAPVDLFVPEVECEDASISLLFDEDYADYTDITYRLDSPSCRTGNFSVSSPCTDYTRPWLGSPYNLYLFERVECLPEGVETATYINNLARGDVDWPPNSSVDIRYATSAARLVLDVDDNENIIAARLDTSVAAICKFQYEIIPITVSSGSTPELPDRPPSNSPLGHLPNLTSYDLTELVYLSLTRTKGKLAVNESFCQQNVPFPGEYDISYNQDWPIYTFFQLVYAYIGRSSAPVTIMEPGVLNKATVSILKGISTEFARDQLLLPDSSGMTSPAEARYAERRLFIRSSPLWVMVALFLILATLCLFLMFSAPSAPTPAITAFGSIASHAWLLGRSPDVLQLLENAGAWGSKQLSQELVGKSFHVQGALIKVSEGSAYCHYGKKRDQGRKKDAEQGKHRWIPLAFRVPIMTLNFLLPLLAVAILEALHRLSDQQQGLVDVDINTTDSQTLLSAVPILSTLAIFGVATLFNNLDFTITTFAPYSRLRRGNAEADESLTFQLLGTPLPVAMLSSLGKHHFGVAASGIAVVCGSLLTIAVSGLWIITPPVAVTGAAIASVERWDSIWAHDGFESGDGGAASVLSAIQHNVSAMPEGIWEDFVIPGVDFPDLPRSGNRSQTFPIPVLRPTFSCKVLSSEYVKVTNIASVDDHGNPTSDTDHTSIMVEAPVSAECDRAAKGIEGRLRFGLTNILTMFEYWVATYHDLKESTAGQVNQNCPSVGILYGGPLKTFGAAVGEQSGYSQVLTALVCTQGIEEIIANVSYVGDPKDGRLDPKRPPKLSSTVSPWSSGPSALATSFGYRLEPYFKSSLAPVIAFGGLPRNDSWFKNLYIDQRTSLNGVVDSFFSNVIDGVIQFPARGLVSTGTERPERDKQLIEAVTKFYKQYMTLVINNKFRPSADASGGAPSTIRVQGVSTADVTRLAIHTPSKITLQALLATMIVFGSIAALSVSIRGTLPREPYSIASVMGFVAGSKRLLAVARDAPQPITEKQLTTLFSGWVYSLGWWARSSQREGEEEAMRGGNMTSTYDDWGNEHSLHHRLEPDITESILEGGERRRRRSQNTNNNDMRFGIDAGRPSILGYGDMSWWKGLWRRGRGEAK